jgi:hypothetical protein
VAAAVMLAYWLTPARLGTPVALSARSKLPVTYVFQTREGGQGLLQITGFTDNPRGVKIRYELVGAKEILLTE